MTSSRKSRQIQKKAKEKAFQQTQYCLTNGCENTVISDCHLISKMSQLAPIANEDKEVAWINPPPGQIYFNKNRSIWRKNKIGKVLVFRGFCGDCDGKVFKSIDDLSVLSSTNVALLNYRAFSYYFWWDRIEIKKRALLSKWGNYCLSSVPPSRVPISHAVKNQEDEAEYIETSNRVIREDILACVTDESNSSFDSVVFDICTDPKIRFSCALPLTVDIFNSVIPLDWSTSIEIPRWFWHFLSVNGAVKLIISWHKKYADLVEQQLHLLLALNDSERSRVIFQFFCFNNMGLACSPPVAQSAESSNFKEIDQYLRHAQEVDGRAKYVGIPPESLEVPIFELGPRRSIDDTS